MRRTILRYAVLFWVLLVAGAVVVSGQTPCDAPPLVAVSRANTVFADLPSQDDGEPNEDGTFYYVTWWYDVEVYRDGTVPPVQVRHDLPRTIWTLVSGTCYRAPLTTFMTVSALAGGKPHRLYLLPRGEYSPADAGAFSNWFCLSGGKCQPKTPTAPTGLAVAVSADGNLRR